jgi:ubiquinone/menaquinone biosynthesis C-methylase UbiE
MEEQGLGEIIDKPAPGRPLEFTGERLTSAITGVAAIEHWHRYLLAREMVRGLDVLDVASGEGYGASLLSQTARAVTGVDNSSIAVAHARSSYVRDNLRFLEGDALAPPLPDASVDAVVSFETLEHFAEHGQFLAEVKRVLRPGGFLLISTPDRDNYSAASGPPNSFHKRELTAPEFEAALKSQFATVRVLGQRVMLGSAMVGAGTGGGPAFCFDRRGLSHFEASTGMARARYLIALASDRPDIDLPHSVFVETDQMQDFGGPLLERFLVDGPSLKALAARNAELEYGVAQLSIKLAAAEREAEELRLRLRGVEQGGGDRGD